MDRPPPRFSISPLSHSALKCRSTDEALMEVTSAATSALVNRPILVRTAFRTVSSRESLGAFLPGTRCGTPDRRTIIPAGDDVILPGDRVVVIAADHRLSDLSDALR